MAYRKVKNPIEVEYTYTSGIGRGCRVHVLKLGRREIRLYKKWCFKVNGQTYSENTLEKIATIAKLMGYAPYRETGYDRRRYL
jgi:hypothetical protein